MAEDPVQDPRPLREAEVVNYADKRVLHARVVSLAERFADLKVRYGRTPEALVRINPMESAARPWKKNYLRLALRPCGFTRNYP